MKKSKCEILSIIICTFSLIITLLIYPALPDQIAIHFDLSGVVNNNAPKIFIFIFAFLPLLLTLIWAKISKQSYPLLIVSMNLFLIAINWLIIGLALGYNINIILTTNILLGVFFISMGLGMLKIKRNNIYGVKTPWTINNEDIWKKTQKLSGVLFIISGIITTVLGFTPQPIGITISLSLILVCSIIPVVYSHILYKMTKI